MVGVCDVVFAVVYVAESFAGVSGRLHTLLLSAAYPLLLLETVAGSSSHVWAVGIHIGGWYGLPVAGIASNSVSLSSWLRLLPSPLLLSLLLNSAASASAHAGSSVFSLLIVAAETWLLSSLRVMKRVTSAVVP